MKILFIASDVNLIGGIEKYNRDLLNALEKTGIQTSLVMRNKGGVRAKISFAFRILWAFGWQRPNLICCAHLNFSPLCLALNLLFKTPFTLTLYGIEISGMTNRLKRKAATRALYLITISEYAKNLILAQLPSAGSRIYLLPSAVDGNIFRIRVRNEQLQAQHGLTSRPVILSLARLSESEHKGQDRVLKAMSLVLKQVPNAIYLVVGGGTDARIEEILREQPELRSNVVFAGAASNDQRVEYYNLADVYVLPSKFEGFGIVFIESLSCGIPVVASDGYGCRAGLLNGELGLLVPPDDITAIAQSIVSILKKTASPVLFDREELRHKTLAVYGIDKWNERVNDLVKRLGFVELKNQAEF
jgi:glycosyltransferase involved in cell wall biosynthesis